MSATPFIRAARHAGQLMQPIRTQLQAALPVQQCRTARDNMHEHRNQSSLSKSTIAYDEVLFLLQVGRGKSKWLLQRACSR